MAEWDSRGGVHTISMGALIHKVSEGNFGNSNLLGRRAPLSLDLDAQDLRLT